MAPTRPVNPLRLLCLHSVHLLPDNATHTLSNFAFRLFTVTHIPNSAPGSETQLRQDAGGTYNLPVVGGKQLGQN